MRVRARLHGLVLNACETKTLYSHYEKGGFTSKPGFVISTNKAVSTGAGVLFLKTFYRYIARGRSLLDSYYLAVLQICIAFPKDSGIHELHINEARLAEIVAEIESKSETMPKSTNLLVCVMMSHCLFAIV